MKIAVAGGGVIGLSVAWRAAQRGAEVVVIDEHPGRGASWAAGGMLAPVAEVYEGEEPLLHLGLASNARWPAFAAELAAAAGTDVGYSHHATLVIARDSDEAAGLARLHELQVRLSLPAERLSSREARRREPALAPTIRGGLWLPDDHQVDNRLLVAALGIAADRAGVEFVARSAVRLTAGAVVLDDATTVGADVVVAATGAYPVPITTATGEEIALPVRPVKGQILRVRTTEAAVTPIHTIRGPGIYLVPRPHGEIAIGATAEERGYDTTVTTGAVADLLRHAWELVPGLAETTFVEATAGLRPGTPDNAPLIGPVGPTDSGGAVIAAMGHYRAGVLLAPITAELVVSTVFDGGPTEPDVAALLSAFAPDRFAPVTP